MLGYAFPPFSIIHLVLQKLIQDKATIVLVAPFWQSQPWFTLLANTICQEPVVITVKDNELFLPFINTMLSCRRDSTNRLYATYIDRWRQYCEREGVDPLSPPSYKPLNFLQAFREHKHCPFGVKFGNSFSRWIQNQ